MTSRSIVTGDSFATLLSPSERDDTPVLTEVAGYALVDKVPLVHAGAKAYRLDDDYTTSIPPISPLSSSQASISASRYSQSQNPKAERGQTFSKSSFKMADKAPKKRPSLQSLFIPSFLQPTPSSTATFATSSVKRGSRTRSNSAVPYSVHPSKETLSASVSPRGSPPLFLLDDDPFANLSTGSSHLRLPQLSPSLDDSFDTPNLSMSPETIPPTPVLSSRSSLSPPSSAGLIYEPALAKSASQTSFSSPTAAHSRLRPQSSGHGQVRPAYTRPAFRSRPSLPSLQTLTRTNVVLPTNKVRRGRVGAQLPYEPWNMNSSSEGTPNSAQEQREAILISPERQQVDPPSQSFNGFIQDFTLSLGGEYDDSLDQRVNNNPESSARSFPYPGSHSQANDTDTTIAHAGSQAELKLPRSTVSPCTSTSPPSPTRSTSSESSSTTSSCAADLSSSPPHTPTPVLAAVSSDYGLLQPSRDYFESDSFDSLSDTEDREQFSDQDPISHTRFTSRIPSSDFEFESSDWTSYGLLPAMSEESKLVFEPSTSSETIRGKCSPPTSRRAQSSPVPDRNNQLVDSDGHDQERTNYRGYVAGWGNGERNDEAGDGARKGKEFQGYGGRQDGSSGGRDDEQEDKRHRPGGRSSFSTPSSSDESNSDEEEDTDNAPRGISLKMSRAPESASATDDDVPLAQRIPGALKAQRTIRKQVRDERDRRRKERAERAQKGQASTSHQAAPPPHDVGVNSLQTSAVSASGGARHRTRTLPSSTVRPFVDDLTKRLMNVQASGFQLTESPLGAYQDQVHSRIKDQSRAPPQIYDDEINKSTKPRRPTQLTNSQVTDDTRERGPKVSKSIRYPDRGNTPPLQAQRLGRSITSATGARERTALESDVSGFAHKFDGDLRRSLEKSSRSRRTSGEGRRPSRDGGAPRTSSEFDSAQRPTQRPSLSSSDPITVVPSSNAKIQMTQQRVFIGDMQRFNMVEIGLSTSAKDVIEMVENQGALEAWNSSGGWMLWEISQDFGMERPVRSYELLSDVTMSWNKDKMVNMFVIKGTPLAPLLSQSAMPSVSPINSGYVEWESKRGKWNKRWLQLREHGLWLSKRDTGKDETFLCALSNFDAYFVTRLHKAPKPFVFAVKSTDKLSLFENAADYVHIFSCSEADGKKWIEKILLARSYVLYQERNVLFSGKAGVTATGNTSKSLSRSGTRKQASGQRPQHLISVNPPFGVPASMTPQNSVFEPGSLLARHH